jgi:GNAT superfamily N-acetyltransferase
MSGVTTYYLQMLSPDHLVASEPAPELDVIEAEISQYEVNRFLYRTVGRPWQWSDKLSLSDEAWAAYCERDCLRTWIAYHRGAIAGYYELEQLAGEVEIKYFGLLPDFTGRGFGGYLLSHAVRSAWSWPGTRRVWVHTCTLDHPRALDNYKARGFREYLRETD